MTTSTLPLRGFDLPVQRSAYPLAARLSLLTLLTATALLYLWGLSASHYANSFYSAAAEAGAQSWRAFFFGSLDAGNGITVDKPPASLWLMALSVRIFGLSSWSILAPQALLGVATVGVLYASVRRTAGHWAGIAAGLILAVTPVAVLMFRFNNPDALLVFLLTLAGYLTLRATERASGRLLAVAGVVVGFAFLTKMLQAFLVLPAFALVYLVAAPAALRQRLLHLLGAFGAVIGAAGWWVAVVELVPDSWRPYVGGSQTNSVLELIFGYNGFGRLTGNETGSVLPGGGAPGAGRWGETGITRLFSGVSGGMVGWLIPAALVLAAAALLLRRRAPRTDPLRAGVLAWAGWLVVTGLVFSFMAGIYHDYYTVVLAPAIAGCVAIGGRVAWQARDRWLARGGLALAAGGTGAWAFVLLGEATGGYAALRWPVLVVGLVATAAFLLGSRLPRPVTVVALILSLTAGLAGPLAYSLNTAATPHQGSIVTAGPVGGGGLKGGSLRSGGPGGRPAGAAERFRPPGADHQDPPGGGFLAAAQVSSEAQVLLEADASSYRWVAAATGAQFAASYQLATQQPVLAIGGFNGSDPYPTLAQFQALVAQHQIHYYLTSGPGERDHRGGSETAEQIATWVAANFSAKTIGGVTVYDLTQTS